MTRQEAIRLALNVLRPFAEAGNIYDDYQTDATHNIFIAENKATWASVRVFDSYV